MRYLLLVALFIAGCSPIRSFKSIDDARLADYMAEHNCTKMGETKEGILPGTDKVGYLLDCDGVTNRVYFNDKYIDHDYFKSVKQ